MNSLLVPAAPKNETFAQNFPGQLSSLDLPSMRGMAVDLIGILDWNSKTLTVRSRRGGSRRGDIRLSRFSALIR